MRHFRIGAFALLLAGAVPLSATADQNFLSRFDGAWSGSGTVLRDLEGDGHQVKCRMAGSNAGQRISINGSCSAYLVFNRQIGAEIALDPSSGRYTGTYTGSKIGAASLSGSKKGDAIELTISWPAEVNGDRTAQMRIVNDGSGRMRITVLDRDGASGPLKTTTDLALSRG